MATKVAWLPPEPHNGPVEYKRQIVPRDNTRRERLETQMRYRLDGQRNTHEKPLRARSQPLHPQTTILLSHGQAPTK